MMMGFHPLKSCTSHLTALRSLSWPSSQWSQWSHRLQNLDHASVWEKPTPPRQCQTPRNCWHPLYFLCSCWHSPVLGQCPGSGLDRLSVRVGQGPSTRLYQRAPGQWLPGGCSKCKTDVHLSQHLLGHFLCSSTDLAPSHSHWYEEKTSTTHAIWIRSPPSLQLIMFLSINAS